ncbi:hypothetical protein [Poseidonibacter ostreae]|uniref:Uncharacterized protein n=1 Tax=Poseidonibacter ostreae TaxID=2654171 RepID=A0A6L4WWZ2_9BACT|nr:hypothetical protein [Poseidonibacter ostreae]KAB7891365.1 hypothetical protein GBG19_00585 [Poseidonibacter ostreae]
MPQNKENKKKIFNFMDKSQEEGCLCTIVSTESKEVLVKVSEQTDLIYALFDGKTENLDIIDSRYRDIIVTDDEVEYRFNDEQGSVFFDWESTLIALLKYDGIDYELLAKEEI